MDIILSHSSALQFYQGDPDFIAPAIGRGIATSSCAPYPKLTPDEAATISNRYGLSLPVHALLLDGKRKRPTKFVVPHMTAGVLGPGDIKTISNGLRVVSPELCFIQMATVLDFPLLLKFGFELCGTYRPGNPDNPYNHKPFTSVESLRKFADQCTNLAGIEKARQALAYVRDGSASAMETRAAIQIGLPCRLGGLGMGMPSMNHKVELTPEARHMSGKRYCKCDLFWPEAMLDVEFESYEFHGSKEKQKEDSDRRSALQMMKIEVVTLTYDQLDDLGKLNGLGSMLAVLQGRRFRPRSKGYCMKQLVLRDSLR